MAPVAPLSRASAASQTTRQARGDGTAPVTGKDFTAYCLACPISGGQNIYRAPDTACSANTYLTHTARLILPRTRLNMLHACALRWTR